MGSVDLPLIRLYNQLQSEGDWTFREKLCLPARSFRFRTLATPCTSITRIPAVHGSRLERHRCQGRKMMTDIRMTYLFKIALNLGEIQLLGKTPLGDRRVAVVEGGSFEGPKLKGTILKGGSDWLIIRPDGALQLDVRLTLKTNDGDI